MTVLTYLLYFALSIPLTVWVARALNRHGQVFLDDVFHGDTRLAQSVNQLLVIGFYLLNLGYVATFMTSHATITTGRQLMEVLSTKVGAVAIVLGVLHLVNVFAFNSFRRRAVMRARALPPVSPNGSTPVVGGQPAPPEMWAPAPLVSP